ncbi:hypothetical protein LTR78_003870 [Recurvomyces mirabilis]|uniref:Uncharacterized protein n=1 Tax=Recurvomyces mirabilis TaxID=574656 RepID=A0AAE1C2W9_9PEZI|nr:hypothetical protein LTR78_003870 [Recurvomyces mirabilis]KAK5153991.1 hypothetical protein LTS14_007211 [Recurvomyces mirabilis]
MLSGQKLRNDNSSSQSLGYSAGPLSFAPERGPVSRQKSNPSKQYPTDWKTLSASELQVIERYGEVVVVYTDGSTHYHFIGPPLADGSPKYELDQFGQSKPKTSGFSVAWRGEGGEFEADAYSTGAASSSRVEIRALDAAIHTAFELCHERRKVRALLVSDSLDAIHMCSGPSGMCSKMRPTDPCVSHDEIRTTKSAQSKDWIQLDLLRHHLGQVPRRLCWKLCGRRRGEWSRRNMRDAARVADLRLAAKQQEVTTTGSDEDDFLTSTSVPNEQPPQLPGNTTGQAVMVVDPGVAKRTMSKTFITHEMQQAGLEATVPKSQDDDASGSGIIDRGSGRSNGSEPRKKLRAESDGILRDSGDDGSMHRTSKKSRRSAFGG